MSKTTDHLFETNHPLTWCKGEGRGLAREARREDNMSYDINDIVYSLLGMNPPNLGISGATDPEDSFDTLANREYELGQLDLSAVGDEFEWYYRREIPLDLVDAEARIEEREEELDELRDYFKELRSYCLRNPNDNNALEELTKVMDRGVAMREDLDRYKLALDLSLTPTPEEVPNAPTRGQALYTYLEMYIDRMSLGELAVAMDTIETLRAEEAISWYYYIQTGLAVSYRLAKATEDGAGWNEVLVRLRSHNKVNHTKAISYEDALFASMALDIDGAVDLMAKVRELASLNHTDEWSMYVEMMSRREESLGILEGWAEPLPQHEVDALLEAMSPAA
jgi:hypothetical protein